MNFAQTIYIASDHAGVALKSVLVAQLSEHGITVKDLGPATTDSVDYPDYAKKIIAALQTDKNAKSIAICGSGIGISIALNRAENMRAALCQNAEMARLARQHNDANILVLGARFTAEKEAKEMVEIFLTTQFEGGRHQTRIDKIEQ